MSIVKSMKRSFWRGLAALVPSFLTIVVLYFALSFVYNYLGRHVNQVIILILAYASGKPVLEIEAWYHTYWLGWLGVAVAVIGICMAAYFLGTFIGRRIMRILEVWMVRLPILRRIYPGAKQVSEFFFSERQVEFRRVVAIEYPRRGLWSIGFVTGRGFRALARQAEQELLTVFVPSSPTPITGYVIAVPRRDVIDLPITVDEALPFLISGGVIMPPAERLESLEVALMLKRDNGKNQKTEDAPPAALPAPPKPEPKRDEGTQGRRDEGTKG
jgi:uncharacterized membrane protein